MTTIAEHMRVGDALDAERIRADFPILGIRPRGKRLVYLDSAATSQKPDPMARKAGAELQASQRSCSASSASLARSRRARTRRHTPLRIQVQTKMRPIQVSTRTGGASFHRVAMNTSPPSKTSGKVRNDWRARTSCVAWYSRRA